MISSLYQEDPTPMFSNCKNLKAFASRGSFTHFSGITHTNLQILVLVTGGMPSTILNGIFRCNFPQLKHLEIWIGSSNYGNDTRANDIAQYFPEDRENGLFPMLEYFGLRNCDNIQDYVSMIAKSFLMSRIRILDFSLCGISHQSCLDLVHGLIGRKETLYLLELVDLHRNALNDQQATELMTLFGELQVVVDLTNRRRRYIAVGE